jgi:hypothetical protein
MDLAKKSTTRHVLDLLMKLAPRSESNKGTLLLCRWSSKRSCSDLHRIFQDVNWRPDICTANRHAWSYISFVHNKPNYVTHVDSMYVPCWLEKTKTSVSLLAYCYGKILTCEHRRLHHYCVTDTWNRHREVYSWIRCKRISWTVWRHLCLYAQLLLISVVIC